jgi:hypothetical protein
VPDDDQDGAGDGDLGLGLAAAPGDPVVALAEERAQRLLTQVIRRLIPASRLSGVGRNPSRALRVAFGDGLRPLPTEPAR